MKHKVTYIKINKKKILISKELNNDIIIDSNVDDKVVGIEILCPCKITTRTI
jgi:uncharacterized protein YuzE